MFFTSVSQANMIFRWWSSFHSFWVWRKEPEKISWQFQLNRILTFSWTSKFCRKLWETAGYRRGIIWPYVLSPDSALNDFICLHNVVTMHHQGDLICVCIPPSPCLSVCLFLGFDLVRCEEPGTPSYGYKIQDDGHFANTFVLYSCNPGYSLHGSSTLTCLSGDRRVWDKPLPSCVGKLANTCLGHTNINNRATRAELLTRDWFDFLIQMN